MAEVVVQDEVPDPQGRGADEECSGERPSFQCRVARQSGTVQMVEQPEGGDARVFADERPGEQPIEVEADLGDVDPEIDGSAQWATARGLGD